MLLCCCDYYPGHKKEAPGIGVVTGIQIDTAKEFRRNRFLRET